MSTPYQITITMDDSSASSLKEDGYILYAFKAVQGPGDGVPLVWFQTSTYSDTTVIQWTESYQAYTSTQTQLSTNVQITASASYGIDLGQVLNVTSTAGTGTVAEGPDPQAIAIYNATQGPFTCGISQQQGDGSYECLCAFPLPGQNEDLIVPIEQVFLMFATLPVNTGTVVEQSYGPGVLVDLTSENEQTVQYSFNGGWTAEPWATVYPPNTHLVPLMITAGSDAAVAAD